MIANRFDKEIEHQSKQHFRLNKVSSIIAGIALGLAVIPGVQAQNSDPAVDNAAAELEEVVVTGIRRSLRDSAALKRNSSQVVDGISAEDLGKFPDVNVAESLQRITGVAITRTRGGEGQFVTVRGLGEEFNGVTYNNRLIATENNGREFSFDVIASELISGAQVFKSTTSSQGDGSLGGLVNIQSARPLDNPGFRASGSVSTQYENLADDFGLRASGVVSNSWANDTMGILASFSYQQRDARTDVAESIFLVNDVQVDANGIAFAGDLDANGDGLNDESGAAILTRDARFNSFAAGLAEQELERIGGTVAFQYTPSDQFSLTLDALYTTFENPSELDQFSFFPSVLAPGLVSNAQLNGANQVVSFDAVPFATEFVGRRAEGDSETIALGANAEWKVGESSYFTLDVAYSEADGQRDDFGSAGGSGEFFVIGYTDGFIQQRFTGGPVPDVFYTAANTPGAPQVPLSDLSPLDARLHFARTDIVEVSDEVFSIKGDYELEIGSTSSLKVGFDFVDREKANTAFNNIPTQCFFCGYATPFSVGGDPATLFDGLTPGNFLSSSGANVNSVFPRLNIDVLRAAFNGLEPGVLDPILDQTASFVVDESVLGAYVQLDFEGTLGELPYRANAGVRFAQTDLTSTGFGNVLSDITSVVQATDGNNQTFTLNSPSAVSVNNDYFDVLPSFNFSVDLTDQWILRSGFSRSLSRPTLTDLSTRFSIASTNVGGEAITRSNPELEAIRSNNFDFSAEWYGEGGTYFSAALFYKDITDFVTQVVTDENVVINDVQQQLEGGGVLQRGPTEFTFRVQEPSNGDTAEIYGIEVGGQYLASNGLGVAANFTLVESEATSGGNVSQLENISDLAANLSLFYEDNKWAARVSYNFRSDYLVGQTFEGGRDEFIDDFQQVDLSVSYYISDSLTLFAEGINVFEEDLFRFSETQDFLETFEINGSRWVFGLRGNL